MNRIHKALRQSVRQHLVEGQLDEAEELCRESLLILEEFCPVHTDVVSALCRLGWILDRRQEWTEALECAERAEEILDELGESTPRPLRDNLLFETLTLHGVALRQLGRYRQAEVCFQRVFTVAEANRDVPDQLVTACNNLAQNYKLAGNLEQAACFYGLAILFASRAFGEVNALTAAMCYHLASLQWSRGRFQEGLTPARQSWEMRRTLLGDAHPDTVAAEAVLLQLQSAIESEAKARPRRIVLRAASASLQLRTQNVSSPTLPNTITLTGCCCSAV
ncbi:tetratricopeptide repeat protein [Paludibaculum fermentans]|uniref:tetratricopeptide repeat protein n=1 Tax=Paludibaculum fermentans TaxID=1473598 RepID=UPI003EBA6638